MVVQLDPCRKGSGFESWDLLVYGRSTLTPVGHACMPAGTEGGLWHGNIVGDVSLCLRRQIKLRKRKKKLFLKRKLKDIHCNACIQYSLPQLLG